MIHVSHIHCDISFDMPASKSSKLVLILDLPVDTIINMALQFAITNDELRRILQVVALWGY